MERGGVWAGGGAARTALLLVLLTLLALALRVYRLDEQSAWYDENHYFIAAAPDFQTYVDGVRVWAPDNVILYQVLFWGWTRIFGLSLVAGRLFTVLIGLSAVPLAFLLGRRVFSPAAGGFAALLTALSPAQIWHAQTMRPYGLCVPLVLFGLYALLRAAEGGGWKWWAAALAANIVMMWTHLFMGFVLPAQGLFLLVRHPHGLRNAAGWAAANLLAVVPPVLWVMPRLKFVPPAEYDHFYLPSLRYVLVDSFGDDVIPWSSEFPVHPPQWAALLPGGVQMETVLGVLWAVSVALLSLAALPGVVRRLRGGDPGPFMLLCAAYLPVLLLVALSYLWRPCVETRHTPFSTIPIYLLAGAALFSGRRTPIRAAAAAALAALLAFQTAWFLPAVSRTDWRAVAGQIARRADPGDVVLVKGVPMWGVDTLVGNKRGPLPRVVAAHTLESVCNKSEALLAGRLSDTGLRERPDRVWVVFEMAFHGPEEVAHTLGERLAPAGTRVEGAHYPGMMGLSLLELSRGAGGLSASGSAEPAASFTDYDRLLEAAHTPPDARGQELEALREVVDLPTGLGAHDFWVLSVLLSEEGRFDSAARFAQASLSASRDYPPAYLALGVALCGVGRKEEARRALDRALALDPAYGRLYGRLFSSCLEAPDQTAASAELARLAPLGPPYLALAGMARRVFPGMDPPPPGMP